jgi:hypothetical protein
MIIIKKVQFMQSKSFLGDRELAGWQKLKFSSCHPRPLPICIYLNSAPEESGNSTSQTNCLNPYYWVLVLNLALATAKRRENQTAGERKSAIPSLLPDPNLPSHFSSSVFTPLRSAIQRQGYTQSKDGSLMGFANPRSQPLRFFATSSRRPGRRPSHETM